MALALPAFSVPLSPLPLRTRAPVLSTPDDDIVDDLTSPGVRWLWDDDEEEDMPDDYDPRSQTFVDYNVCVRTERKSEWRAPRCNTTTMPHFGSLSGITVLIRALQRASHAAPQPQPCVPLSQRCPDLWCIHAPSERRRFASHW